MTISQLKFNTTSRADYPSAQNAKPCQQSFSSALNQAQKPSTERAHEAREVLRLVQECMLGQLTYQDGDIERLTDYDFIQPFISSGYASYREVSTAAIHQYSQRESAPQQIANSAEVKESVQPSFAQQTNIRANIENLIDQVAQRVGLPATLLRSVVSTESSFRPDAVSPVGAQGLMQLMPSTAEEMGVENSFDPHQNLLGGCRYLKRLINKYDGDLDHALAAYNWGQGNVDRKGLEQMPAETSNYIARVKQASLQFG